MESLPIPDEQLLKILYELPSKDLSEMAKTSSHFRNLISAPGFWDRKGQYLANSPTLPTNPYTDIRFYNATNWKDYIITVENIVEIVQGLIRRLRVMDEPEYIRDETGGVDDDDLLDRNPEITIYPKIIGSGTLSVDKREGNIIVSSEGNSGYLFQNILPGASDAEIETIKKEQEEIASWFYSKLAKMKVTRIVMISDRQKLFEATF